MRFTAVLAVVAAAAFFAAGTTLAQSQKQASGPAKSDVRDMKKLAQDNLAEIEAGKLAMDKAQDPQVKDFAQKMVNDHTQLLDDLKKVAEAKNVELPTAPDAKHRRLMKKLQSASGTKFDREYMNAMVKDHRSTLKLVQHTAKGAKDADLKSAAQQATPQIQDHLKMAQSLSKSEKRSGAGKTGAAQSGSQAGAAR